MQGHDEVVRVEIAEFEGLGGFYSIRKCVEYRGGMERTGPCSFSYYDNTRVSDACAEGPTEEMILLCRAVLHNESAHFKRCAVAPNGDWCEVWSPRNSQLAGLVPASILKAAAFDFLTKQGYARLVPGGYVPEPLSVPVSLPAYLTSGTGDDDFDGEHDCLGFMVHDWRTGEQIEPPPPVLEKVYDTP